MKLILLLSYPAFGWRLLSSDLCDQYAVASLHHLLVACGWLSLRGVRVREERGQGSGVRVREERGQGQGKSQGNPNLKAGFNTVLSGYICDRLEA